MINELRIKIAGLLGIDLINTNYLFIDYWVFIHFFSGFFGMWLIFKLLKEYDTKRKFIVLIVFVFFWEIFEIFSPSLIKPEKFIDVFYDFIFGVIGGYSYYFWKRRK